MPPDGAGADSWFGWFPLAGVPGGLVLVGAQVAELPVNDTGLPPESIGQDWLWVEYGGELLAADVDGVYELEPVAGSGPTWVYIWAPAGR